MDFLRPQELLIILLIVLVLFGGSKLPDLAKNLGRARRELQSGFDEGSKPEKDTDKDKQKDQPKDQASSKDDA
jgi:sec-independent protein translocase protein TatA